MHLFYHPATTDLFYGNKVVRKNVPKLGLHNWQLATMGEAVLQYVWRGSVSKSKNLPP